MKTFLFPFCFIFFFGQLKAQQAGLIDPQATEETVNLAAIPQIPQIGNQNN